MGTFLLEVFLKFCQDFLPFSDIERNFFVFPAQVFRQVIQNGFLRVHENIPLRRDFFSPKRLIFSHQFRIFDENFSTVPRQVFDLIIKMPLQMLSRAVKSAFYVTIRTIWGEVFLGKNTPSSVSNLEGKMSAFC